MKKVTLMALAVCMFSFAHAQTNAQSAPANGGSFFITQTTSAGSHQLHINYTIMPTALTTELNLTAEAWEQTMLGFKIRNSRNEVLMTWKPEQNTKLFVHTFNISNLAVGGYKLDMYGPNGNLVKTVSFQKQ